MKAELMKLYHKGSISQYLKVTDWGGIFFEAYDYDIVALSIGRECTIEQRKKHN